jgi:two-component system response regulator GlrR
MSSRDSRPASTVSLGFGMASPGAPKADPNEQPAAPLRRPHVMVVDEDPEVRRSISSRLGSIDYQVTTLQCAQEALDSSVRERPHLVISELKLRSINGFELLKELKSRWPDMTVIILTAYGTIPDAVRATQAGAFGFLIKPLERDELLGQVQRAIAVSTFARIEGDWRSNIVARSQLMEERLAQANSAAAANSPVLLTGQNGTGKELLARAIHAASPRRSKPFMTLNCRDALEADLDQALFADGAALDACEGGTLLLEEIGAMPLRVQARLANAIALEPPTNARSGARRREVRIICTTSRDLKALMLEGGFRQDLFYPLTVMSIEVPPLGRRREDIPLLVSHFLEQATEGSRKKKIYTSKAIELLATTDWPGNVRQLFDLVKHNVALTSGKIITEAQVRDSLGKDSGSLPSYHEAREQFSREYLTQNLQRAHGNVTEAARIAKRHRSDFYTLLNRFRLNAQDFKTPGPAVTPHKPAE